MSNVETVGQYQIKDGTKIRDYLCTSDFDITNNVSLSDFLEWVNVEIVEKSKHLEGATISIDAYIRDYDDYNSISTMSAYVYGFRDMTEDDHKKVEAERAKILAEVNKKRIIEETAKKQVLENERALYERLKAKFEQ